MVKKYLLPFLFLVATGLVSAKSPAAVAPENAAPAPLVCNVITAPWQENFEGANWAPGVGGTNLNNSIDPCWSRPSGNNPNFGTVSGATGSGSTGPTSGAGGWGKYIYTEASSAPGRGEITSPQILIPSTFSNPRLLFQSHMFGNGIDSLVVEIDNGNGFNTVYTLKGQQQVSNGAPWQLNIVDLSAFLGDTIQIRFAGTNSNYRGDIALDQVIVMDVTCPEPTNLSITNVTSNSVQLSWTSGGASAWKVGYRVAGSTSPVNVLAASSTSFSVSGLNPDTHYEFFVRDSCGPGNLSFWQGPVDTITTCDIFTAPWSENFDGSKWTPGVGGSMNNFSIISRCWTRPNGANPDFSVGTSGTTSSNTGPSGDVTTVGNYLYTEASNGAFGTGEILSPEIYIPSGLNTAELTFDYHLYGADIASLAVSINTGSGFSQVYSISGQQQSSSTDAWETAYIDLSNYVGDTVQFRFEGTNTGFNADIAIDEVQIDTNVCVPPDSVYITGASASSLSAAWPAGNSTDWQVTVVPLGSSPGSGAIIGVSSAQYTFTGLSADTEYCIYVRDSCGAGDVSRWINTCGLTDCGFFTAPWIENFDGSEWVIGTGSTNDGNLIHHCWTRPSDANPNFGTGSGPTTSVATGPNLDVSGTGNYLYTEGSSGALGTGEITSPRIYIPSGLNSASLQFAYHIYGSNIDSLVVSVSNNGSPFATEASLIGQQQSSNAEAWLTELVDLSSYIGDTIRIKFAGTNSGFNSDMAIDEILVDTSACLPPDSFYVASVSSSSLSLDWVTGGASNWLLEYGPTGFTPGTGTTIAITSAPPYTLTGLSPNTEYCFFLRDSCGSGNVSPPVSLCATTDCNILNMPWSENFDGTEWISGIGPANTGNEISGCWSRPNANNPNFGTRTGGTSSNSTGPGTDVSGTGNYLYTEASGAVGPGQITGPSIFIPSTAGNAQLSFMYHMYGANINFLNVEINDGSGFSQIHSINGEQQTANTDPWQEAIVDLTSYVGDTVQIRFIGSNSGFPGDIAIDEVSLNSVSCPMPDSLQVTSKTGSSINLSWISGGASAWEIRYRPVGTTTYTVVSTTSNPYLLSNLQPGVSYEISVRDSCAVGDVSDWHPQIIASTACNGITAPWSENFDGGLWTPGFNAQNNNDQIDPCWYRPSNTGRRLGTGTGATPSANTGPDDDYSVGGNYIYLEASLSGGPTEIETPVIYIPPNMVQPELEYYYHMYGAQITSLTVEINSGTGYQLLQTISGQQQASSAGPWLKDSISLASYLGDSVRIRFAANVSGWQGDIAIDEVSITGALNTCSQPSQISFSAITPTSATVSWNSPSGNSFLEIVPDGQPQGSGTTYAPVSSPYIFSNLLPNTTYDIYLRDSCTSFLSNWVDSSFTTLPCPAPIAAFTMQDNLLQVNFDTAGTLAADTLQWDFGDGNSGWGGNQSHSYATPGSYQVTLIASNNCGNADTLVQTVEVCDTLTPDFYMLLNGDTLTLDAGNSKGAVNYYWNLGNVTDTAGMALSYVFPSTGTKTIELTVVNACGDSLSLSKSIKICKPPLADWTYTILGTTGNGMEVQFDGSASENALYYSWDFGDGTTTTGTVQPVHTYLTPGLFYRVELTVTNDCGEKHTRKFKLSQIGFEEMNLISQIELYPNPADERVVIEWPWQELSLKSVQVVDATGKAVVLKNVGQNIDGKIQLDVSKLPAGYFLLRFNTDGGWGERPLIIR